MTEGYLKKLEQAKKESLKNLSDDFKYYKTETAYYEKIVLRIIGSYTYDETVEYLFESDDLDEIFDGKPVNKNLLIGSPINVKVYNIASDIACAIFQYEKDKDGNYLEFPTILPPEFEYINSILERNGIKVTIDQLNGIFMITFDNSILDIKNQMSQRDETLTKVLSLNNNKGNK